MGTPSLLWGTLEGNVSPRAKVANNRKRKPPAADPVIKALIAVTKAEEKAVNRVGHLSLTAVGTFQKVSRSLLGIPARWIRKNRSAAWRSKSRLTSQRAA
jgi:hypothetical protein